MHMVNFWYLYMFTIDDIYMKLKHNVSTLALLIFNKSLEIISSNKLRQLYCEV